MCSVCLFCESDGISICGTVGECDHHITRCGAATYAREFFFGAYCAHYNIDYVATKRDVPAFIRTREYIKESLGSADT